MILLITLLGILQSVLTSPSFYTSYYKPYNYYLPSYQYTIPQVSQFPQNPQISQIPQNPQISQIPQYSPITPTFFNNPPVLPPPETFPPLNILAEVPSSISTSFTVVPMVVVAKENMNLVSGGEIMNISKDKPEMTLKLNENDLLQATPAVKIALDQPILVHSVRSQILFPANVDIVHQGYKLPIRIGTIIAPVEYESFINNNGPISLKEVFAVPAEPIRIDYVNNNKGVIIQPENDAVVIEDNSALFLPPKNISVIVLPNKEGEPALVPDEEDDELVNRNPPIVLAPGGISASLQPTILEGPFSNSKESAILTELREEALKRY